jgi:hypothetical protein
MRETKRAIVALVLLGVLALPAGPALAGGAFAPPPPGLVLSPSREITATIVVDPHLTTSTPQYGYITVSRKHYPDATALFPVQLFGSFGVLALGCDLTLTAARVLNANPSGSSAGVYAPLNSYIPDAVVNLLFSQLGVTTGPALQPAVTQVNSQACAPSVDSAPAIVKPGFLVLDVDIGFWAAPGAPTPK